MSSRHRIVMLGSTLALALAACKQQPPPAPPPPEVGVIQVKPQNLPLQRDLVGRLSAYRRADVRARVPGVLQKRLYTEGTDVKEGQVLFQIDPAPLQAALSSAQGELASAEATYANARIAAQRARSLAPQAYVSKSDVDNAEAAERTASAAVQQARAAVESARINLDYARVTAPISGRAGQQQVTEGALVGQNEATLLTSIDQIDPLYVNFSMSANELAQLGQAQGAGSVALEGSGKSTVDVLLADGSKYGHQGTLDFSDTSVDPSTGAVSLRALLPNPEHALLPGAFVTFEATLGQRNNVYLIPQQSVMRDTVGAYAMVVGQDGNVLRRNLVTDRLIGGNWLIISGLQPGDQVVVSGIQKIKEGAPAKATPWQPPQAPGASAPAASQSAQK